jgi:hypothetical protein
MTLTGWVPVIAPSKKDKESKYHIYDDETMESMVRYYKVEENFDSFLKYIKNRSINEDVV